MTVHPLEPLTADEIARTVELLRAKEDRVEDTMLIAPRRARRADEGRARARPLSNAAPRSRWCRGLERT